MKVIDIFRRFAYGIFIILAIAGLLLLPEIIPYKFYYQAVIIYLIAISSMTMALIPGSKWYLWGINFDKFATRDVLLGITLPIPAYLVIYFFFRASGAEYNLVEIEFWSFLNLSVIIFCAATAEELLFRGVIFQYLAEKFNTVVITILLSLAFAFAHIPNSGIDYLAFFNTFLAGIVLSIMYLNTRSLALPVIFHFSWNYLQALLYGGHISGVYMLNSPINQENFFSIENVFLGGNYGPESG
jgi:membrane protease YdiL (CAAX protease family)